MSSQAGYEVNENLNDFSSKGQTNAKEGTQNASQSFTINIPKIELPKGGGALRNIDEKFLVNAVNGTASFSIPLPFSKTRNNFGPILSLNYNSGKSSGVFGLGWSCETLYILRKTGKQLPKYYDEIESDAIRREFLGSFCSDWLFISITSIHSVFKGGYSKQYGLRACNNRL
ncbi:MAG: hypothetical protein NVSMB67_27690 [Flavisolibacter sp.]